MSTTEEEAAVVEEEKQNDSSSFLEAATSAMTQQAAEPDIENQQQRPPPLPATDKSVGILAPHKSNRNNNNNNNNGEENDDDDGSSTDSVFSFDSYEMKVTSRRTPLKFQSVINNPNNNTTGGASSTAVPFPSVNATTLDPSSSAAVAMTENVCPCRCLFFTLKESICLVMSALGCAVFLAGLVVLCLYLEGTLFEDEYLEKQ
ncbi:hypothetical protein QTG54_003313 [Skeletonema marinoi]|uniref:Uncharacterized protein n=1 Tax=Skeletonema marinoi TaxID=267567 RepID=A0AAD8YF70_9STRA|nr:hypothetical protein QTG54_003313 [Skeletonema marinoi]